MSLHTAVKETAVATFMPILTLGLPVIDTLSVMVARFVEGPERSFARRFARMFHADRNHLHHRMTRTRLSRKQIVLVIYLVAACFSLMALVVAVHHSVPLGAALVVVEVVVVSAMRQTGARRNVLSLSPKQSAPIPVRTSVQIKYAERH
jgi:UDP-GlcNAc:undecaprenyl-phosphate GlcNAc-1-phosphate transferase